MDALGVSKIGGFSTYESSFNFRKATVEERIASLYGLLRSKDVTLAKNFLTFVTFLKHLAPDMIEDFLDSFEGVLSVKNLAANSSSTFRSMSLHFRLDLKIGIVERVNEGGDVTSTRMFLRLKIDYRMNLTQVKEADPLVLDMNGDGIRLSGLYNPAYFDIDGDGREEKISFVEGDDAFLFLDLNMNKFLDNGWELVGDQFGFKNGFDFLKAFDFNEDDKISSEDPVYRLLYVFQDLNMDKRVQPSEIKSLPEVGISKIGLSYLSMSIKLNNTDRLIALSSYRSAMGERKIGDAVLGYMR